MITIFANIRINDTIRLQHLKDSFFSFNTISDDWIINIRGDLRNEAISFLQKELGNKMTLFELLDDSVGWANNSLKMINKAKYNYLLIWIEDHINTASQNTLINTIEEIQSRKIDYMLYSWWQFRNSKKAFEAIELKNDKYIDFINLTKKEWVKIRNAGHPYYLISLCGIFHKDFLKKLLLKERFKLPMFFTKNLYRLMTLVNYSGIKFNQKKYFHLINKLFFYKLRRFSKKTPFDIEKPQYRTDLLPIKLAISKQELFACIDDDLDMPGYQLIKRGNYPINNSFQIDSNKKNGLWDNSKLLEENNDYTIYKIALKKEKEYNQRYYEDEIRTHSLLKKTIILISGNVEVLSKSNDALLKPGEAVSLYPNIKHTMKAKEDSIILVIYSSLHNKKIKNIIN